MSPNAVRYILLSVLLAAAACSSTDTKTTESSAFITAPTPTAAAPTPPAPNLPGPMVPPPLPAPNPPGPTPFPGPPAPNIAAPNPPGPAAPVRMAGFRIAGAPFQQSVVRGETVTFVVSLRSINGFRGDVTLFARVLPRNELWAGASWSAQPVRLAPDGTATSTLMIATNSGTPVGTQAITVEGRTAEFQDTATLLLTVR